MRNNGLTQEEYIAKLEKTVNIQNKRISDKQTHIDRITSDKNNFIKEIQTDNDNLRKIVENQDFYIKKLKDKVQALIESQDINRERYMAIAKHNDTLFNVIDYLQEEKLAKKVEKNKPKYGYYSALVKKDNCNNLPAKDL